MKAKKKVAKKKVVKNQIVTKTVKIKLPKEEIISVPVTTDNFECAGPVDDTVTDVYVDDIKKGGYESFSYQRRAEDFVEDHVTPVPGENKIFLIGTLALLAIVAYVLYR